MTEKKKILCWSDSPTAGTGFGVVSKHVITALQNTGKYDIHQLAINFHGDFIDEERFPWQIRPAKVQDPRDPHGIKMFVKTVAKGEYDIVWILNDLFVTHAVAQYIPRIKEAYTTRNLKPPVFIYYYPVDCHVQSDASDMVDVVEIPVCYTKHGRAETIKSKPSLRFSLHEIPHGVDSEVYKPLPPDQVDRCKQHYLKVDPSTFVVVAVNRNSTRKQFPYSILAFNEFRKKVPNSIMYCHTQIDDQGGHLGYVLSDLGLSPQTDVIFPGKYSPSEPAPDNVLNQFYNCGDVFLTTHLGEGWGLTITEAMAAGVPVVSPNNTCMPQQLGKNSERGYMYECHDWAHIDSSGFRPKGLISDIVEQLVKVYEAGPKYDNPVVTRAREWAVKHHWSEVTEQWIHLFDQAEKIAEDNKVVVTEEV
jgi:glycosyltransferase involved in cell wall biosynthesis